MPKKRDFTEFENKAVQTELDFDKACDDLNAGADASEEDYPQIDLDETSEFTFEDLPDDVLNDEEFNECYLKWAEDEKRRDSEVREAQANEGVIRAQETLKSLPRAKAELEAELARLSEEEQPSVKIEEPEPEDNQEDETAEENTENKPAISTTTILDAISEMTGEDGAEKATKNAEEENPAGAAAPMNEQTIEEEPAADKITPEPDYSQQPEMIDEEGLDFINEKHDAFGATVGGFSEEKPDTQQKNTATKGGKSAPEEKKQPAAKEQNEIRHFGTGMDQRKLYLIGMILIALWAGWMWYSSKHKAPVTKAPEEKVAASMPKEYNKAVEEQNKERAATAQQRREKANNSPKTNDFKDIPETSEGMPGNERQQPAGDQPRAQELSPDAAKTDITQDPIYQQQQALKQQYLELLRQSYTSKPSVDGGNWTNRDKTSNDAVIGNTLTVGRNSDRVSELNDMARAATEAASQAQKNIASGSAYGNRGTVSSALNSISAALGTGGASQSGKEAFFSSNSSGKGYLGNTRTEKIAPYTLPAGTMIPAALISGINTDLPGNITASVTENVYDWQSANVCLIPQGSRLFGTYSSNVSFGQKRVQVTWQRLIYPDGSTISLEGMSGTDRRGYSGLKDKTHNHYGKMFVATVMTTAFTILPALVENRNGNGGNVYYGNSARDTAASQAASAIGQMGNKFFDKSLNTNPTIQIRPGQRFNVQVNADIPFYRAWRIAGR